MSSPAPSLKGALTVQVIRCRDLEKKRILGKMDPYVKMHVGGEEKFKTRVAKDGDRAPTFDQSFLFNLTGKETDLHLKVFDSEVLGDTVIGRVDTNLLTLLAAGGNDKEYDVADAENFRRITGKITLKVTFVGTGGPAVNADVAPISGLFHFQHNSTGFILHPASNQIQLQMGGLNDPNTSFEFIGSFIRYVPNAAYLTGRSDGSVFLAGSTSDEAKWKWNGVALQHVASSRFLHPLNDQLGVGVPIVLAAGTNAASGFTLVASHPQALSPPPAFVNPPSPQPIAAVSPPAYNPPATNPNAFPSQQQPIQNQVYPNLATLPQQQPIQPLPVQPTPVADPSLFTPLDWHCAFCTFANPPVKLVCEMCSKTRVFSSPQEALAVTALREAASYPLSLHTNVHPHPLFQLPSVYKGVYNCDICTKPGQGMVYHCEPCSFDSHPACAKHHVRS